MKLYKTKKSIIIYIDMDDVLCDYKTSFENKIKESPQIKFPQSQYDFFRKLDPVKDSIESVIFLQNQPIFDVYILTAPSIKNPLCYTEKRIWVEEHLGIELVEKLIISSNKGLLKGNYLIDDNDKGRGQENFEGEIIQFGSKEYPSWKKIIDYFSENYKLENDKIII